MYFSSLRFLHSSQFHTPPITDSETRADTITFALLNQMAKARLVSLERKLQELRVEREQKDHQLSAEISLSDCEEKLEEFRERLDEIRRRLDESAPNPNGGGVNNPMATANAQISPLAFPSVMSSLETPNFGGDNPRTWIVNCEKYFLANPMADIEKVIWATTFMEGRAEDFFETYIQGREEIGWTRFAEMVVDFFVDPRDKDLVGAFNKLKQESSIEVYRDKFEVLKYFMVQSYGTLTEDDFIQSFVSGLKLVNRMMVEMLNPSTLDRAIQIAKIHERSLDITRELDEDTVKDIQASIEGSAQNAIKVRGKVKKTSLSILLVKGSHVGFLDHLAAKRIGCKLEHNVPFLVTVGGQKMDCSYWCKGFEWKMGNRSFTASLRVWKLGGYDMIIGADLLSRPEQVRFDFDQQRVTFLMENKEVVLHGEPSLGIPKFGGDTEKDLQTSLGGRSPPNAIGFTNPIWLIGKANNVSFSIIVVTGSSQSLLDPEAAKRIGCKLDYTKPLVFSMANGGKVVCNSVCRGFKWEIGNHTFTADVRIMKPAGCDMIIGGDILKDWTRFSFDFKKRRIIVQLEEGEEEIILQGEPNGPTQDHYVRLLTCDNPWNL